MWHRPKLCTDATGSCTDGHTVVHGWPEIREAAMYHGTSIWLRGPPPSGCLWIALAGVVYGWPTGRPRMAQPVLVQAVSPPSSLVPFRSKRTNTAGGPGKLHLCYSRCRWTRCCGPCIDKAVDKVVDNLVGTETDLERFFPQICVSHVRRRFHRGSSSCCCRVRPTLVWSAWFAG